MNGESDLGAVLASMSPHQRPGAFVFVVADGRADLGVEVLASVAEEEGRSIVTSQADADRAGLPYDLVASWITLRVHSALTAVGLTAAVSSALAASGISCNVIAGYHHDHLLVPRVRGADALEILERLSAAHHGLDGDPMDRRAGPKAPQPGRTRRLAGSTRRLAAQLDASLTELAAERLAGADEDVHFTESLATAVIESLTDPGDLVLDPFAGFGTTLAVAGRLGRRAIGVELLPERVDLCRGRAPDATVIEGDARGLQALVTQPIDLCLSSPPYMTANLHPHNPLTAYETLDGDYSTYLEDLTRLAVTVRDLLRPGGHLVLNVANIRHAGHTTTLAWDVAHAIGTVLPFVGETVICWDRLPQDFTGDYLLTFRRDG